MVYLGTPELGAIPLPAVVLLKSYNAEVPACICILLPAKRDGILEQNAPDLLDWRNDLTSYPRVGSGNKEYSWQIAGCSFLSINIHWSWQYWYVGAVGGFTTNHPKTFL